MKLDFIGCNGASSMLGRHACVIQHLIEKKYSNMTVWYCSSQCLETAVDDIVSEMLAFFGKLLAITQK
jgi:hypothetical protein